MKRGIIAHGFKNEQPILSGLNLNMPLSKNIISVILVKRSIYAKKHVKISYIETIYIRVWSKKLHS